MTTYVALLRGVNVGAHNRMTMDALRALFESIGYDDVETYIQSGNVVFEATASDEGAIRTAVEDAIEHEFGYDVTVMVRTHEQLAAVVDGMPFDGPAPDGVKRSVTFLHEEPTDEQREALLDAGGDAETFVVRGREVYSELDEVALGDGRFTDAGKKLGMEATRRTWKVVTAIGELASE